MRKETAAIVSAFITEKKCTRARTHTDGNQVWLHDNRIFWRRELFGHYGFSMCGWSSNVTRDRLHALLQACYKFHGGTFENGKGIWIYQRKWRQYVDHCGTVTEIDPRDAHMIKFPRGNPVSMVE